MGGQAAWGLASRFGSHLASVAPMAARCAWEDGAWDHQASGGVRYSSDPQPLLMFKRKKYRQNPLPSVTPLGQVEILCQMQRCTKAGGRLLWKIAVLVKASTVVLCWEGLVLCSSVK